MRIHYLGMEKILSSIWTYESYMVIKSPPMVHNSRRTVENLMILSEHICRYWKRFGKRCLFVFSLSLCICQPWCSIDTLSSTYFVLISTLFISCHWMTGGFSRKSEQICAWVASWLGEFVPEYFLFLFVIFSAHFMWLSVWNGEPIYVFHQFLVRQYMGYHQQYNFTFVFTMIYRIRG